MTNAIRPQHYQTDSGLQAWDAIDACGLAEGFNLGNVLKYTWRFTKTRNVADLEKAATYLNRQIELAKRNEGE